MIQAGDFDDYTRAPPPGQRWLTSLPTPSRRRSCTPSTASSSDRCAAGEILSFHFLLLYAGVLTGSGPECAFRPEATITRAELSALAARMILPKERKRFVVLDRQDLSDLDRWPDSVSARQPDAQRRGGPRGADQRLRGVPLRSGGADGGRIESGQTRGAVYQGEVKELLAQDLQTLGYVVNIASVSAKDVAFGSVPATAMNSALLTAAGNNRLCFCLRFCARRKAVHRLLPHRARFHGISRRHRCPDSGRGGPYLRCGSWRSSIFTASGAARWSRTWCASTYDGHSALGRAHSPAGKPYEAFPQRCAGGNAGVHAHRAFRSGAGGSVYRRTHCRG